MHEFIFLVPLESHFGEQRWRKPEQKERTERKKREEKMDNELNCQVHKLFYMNNSHSSFSSYEKKSEEPPHIVEYPNLKAKLFISYFAP